MLGNLRTAPVMLKSTAMRLNARSASSLPKKALDSLKNAMKQDDRKSTTADMIKQVNDNRKETKNQTGKTEPQPCEEKMIAAEEKKVVNEPIVAAPPPTRDNIAMNTKSSLDAATAFVPKVDFQAFAPSECCRFTNCCCCCCCCCCVLRVLSENKCEFFVRPN